MRIEAYSYPSSVSQNPERLFWHEDKQRWDKIPSKDDIWDKESQKWIRIKNSGNPVEKGAD